MPLQTVDRAEGGIEILKFTSSPNWSKRYHQPTQYLVMKDGVRQSIHTSLGLARVEIGKGEIRQKKPKKGKRKSN